jgi:hypothetical protein
LFKDRFLITVIDTYEASLEIQAFHEITTGHGRIFILLQLRLENSDRFIDIDVIRLQSNRVLGSGIEILNAFLQFIILKSKK